MSNHTVCLLEINHDWTGSKFLIENLCEAAITLIYLLEEVDRALFSEYISFITPSSLFVDWRWRELQKFPNHPTIAFER